MEMAWVLLRMEAMLRFLRWLLGMVLGMGMALRMGMVSGMIGMVLGIMGMATASINTGICTSVHDEFRKQYGVGDGDGDGDCMAIGRRLRVILDI